MSQPYSKLLYAIQGLGGFSGAQRPAVGKIWVVRDVDAYSNAGVGGSEFIMTDDLTGQTVFIASVAATTKGSVEWRGRQVFYNNNGFAFNSNAGLWDIRVSGYELDA